MSDLLRIKRGLKANLPELMQGEFGYCTDTEELFIGGINGNVEVGKSTDFVNVRKAPFKAAGDGIANDTTALQNAANSLVNGGTLLIPEGVYLTDGLILTANTTILGYGGTVKGRSGTADVIKLAANCEVYGLKVDGNKIVKTGGRGIAVISSDNCVVDSCTIINCFEQGIEFFNSNKCRFSNNFVDGCAHGVQWWGGDAAISTVRGIFDLTITGNVVKNSGGGGIWGSLGERVTVQGNTVETCGDVGIDLEGCSYCTVTGNTVKNCSFGAFSLFYGSEHCTFTGNNVFQDTTFGPGLKVYGTNVSKYITFANNIFRGKSANYILGTEQGMLTNSVFIGNQIYQEAINQYAILLLDDNKIVVKDNVITLTQGSTAIRNEGGNDCTFDGNIIETLSDSSTLSKSNGAISFFWRSVGQGAQRCNIRDNIIRGFVTSIAEDNWGDTAAYTWIRGNRLKSIVSSGTSPDAYRGLVENNVDILQPLTAVTRTVV